jgi:hypothetical protein
MKTSIFSSILLPSILVASVSFAAEDTSRSGDFKLSDWSQELKKTPDAAFSQIGSPAAISVTAKKVVSKQSNPEIETLTKARLLFQQGKFVDALEQYDQIERGTDHWLEVVEERGWAYHRQKEFQKALAQTKTLLSQAFLPVIGSEPFFLQSLSQLKICDYKGILETHKLYKESQRQRLLDIKSLVETGDHPALQRVQAKAQFFPLRFTDVGEEAKFLPRLFYRDIAVQKALLEIKLSQASLENLQSRTSAPAGLASELQKLQARAQLNLKARMKILGEIESTENFKMVQKLNLIEVETIQRIHADQKLNPDAYSKGHFAKVDDDQLIFPDDGHPWVDELDKYQVKVNSCPQNIRRKM